MMADAFMSDRAVAFNFQTTVSAPLSSRKLIDKDTHNRCLRCKSSIVQPLKGKRIYCDPCKLPRNIDRWRLKHLGKGKTGKTKEAWNKHRRLNSICHNDHTCNYCGKIFRPKRTDRIHYCSRECSDLARKPITFGGRFKNLRVCPDCDDISDTGSRFCNFCKTYRYAQSLQDLRRPLKIGQCLDCGIQIKGIASKSRCRGCSRKRGRALFRAKHGSVRKHRERARKFCVEYEPINPIDIFERDGWVCQLCGVPTPRELRGSYLPTAPELDHIIPMSKGGPHLVSNVQCSCRQCNHAKGSSIVSCQSVQDFEQTIIPTGAGTCQV